MPIHFVLQGGESAEVYSPGGADSAPVVYRFHVERFVDAELKIVREGESSKIIPAGSIIRTLDVGATQNLFIEAVGSGFVAGWYDAVS